MGKKTAEGGDWGWCNGGTKSEQDRAPLSPVIYFHIAVRARDTIILIRLVRILKNTAVFYNNTAWEMQGPIMLQNTKNLVILLFIRCRADNLKKGCNH